MWRESSGQEERLFRLYADDEPLDKNGYPLAWQRIKVIVRERAHNRCERCGHPYSKGDGEWSLCDSLCTHGQPIRVAVVDESAILAERAVERESPAISEQAVSRESAASKERIEAQWRVLTTHHLNGNKLDCRWWNLVALDQRCHLTIQGKVRMDRVWPFEHSAWFKPYAAAWYALRYLNLELTRAQVMARIDELLALELTSEKLPGAVW